jgi:hypothetical protein
MNNSKDGMFGILFLLAALFLIGFVVNGMYNMYDGVPNKDCTKMQTMNVSIESEGFQAILSGCKVDGCHIGCSQYGKKVAEFRGLK